MTAAPTVALLDHGMGNLRSVGKALEAAGAKVRLVATGEEIRAADAMCVPGQGIFDRCVEATRNARVAEELRGWIESDRPFLGICLGMQILFDRSEEGDGADGLGILPGRVVRLSGDVSIPHIGWNTVNDRYFYFDHSYAVVPEDASLVSGWCEHGTRFAAQVERGRMLATQFHPEKSSRDGIALVRSWLERA